MAFDWRDFLPVAVELADRTDEASQRSATSRAYYAAYGAARAMLALEGIHVPRDGNPHVAVWQAFVDAEDSRRHYVGLDGRSLRSMRNAADYDADAPEVAVMARKAIRKSQTILNALDRVREFP